VNRLLPVVLPHQHPISTQGFQVDLASIKGGPIPFDPASTSGGFLTPEADTFQKDEGIQKLVQSTKSVDEVLGDVQQYDAVFLPGGHGIVFDGPDSAALKKLLDQLYASGKVVSAVCHGPAGLTSATTPAGEPIVKGKRVSGFTNTEEAAVAKDKLVPFLLEDKLKELGGLYERGDDWAPFAVRDGALVTGQNPQSSRRVAELVIEALSPGVDPQHGKGEGAGLHHRWVVRRLHRRPAPLAALPALCSRIPDRPPVDVVVRVQGQARDAGGSPRPPGRSPGAGRAQQRVAPPPGAHEPMAQPRAPNHPHLQPHPWLAAP
jgi:putative intracellular protease/amidase